jgi:hypothetical protein
MTHTLHCTDMFASPAASLLRTHASSRFDASAPIPLPLASQGVSFCVRPDRAHIAPSPPSFLIAPAASALSSFILALHLSVSLCPRRPVRSMRCVVSHCPHIISGRLCFLLFACSSCVCGVLHSFDGAFDRTAFTVPSHPTPFHSTVFALLPLLLLLPLPLPLPHHHTTTTATTIHHQPVLRLPHTTITARRSSRSTNSDPQRLR